MQRIGKLSNSFFQIPAKVQKLEKVYLFQIPAKMEMFDWWEVRQRERVECSCVSMDDGALCVIISGQWLMLMWSVHTSAIIPLVRIPYCDL